MSEQQSEVVIDFGDDEQKIHWLKRIDYHNEEIARLAKEIKEHQIMRDEAEEEFYEDVPKNWDLIKVSGRPVLTREVKEGNARVYMEDLKDRYPKVYQELLRKKNGEKVNRLS